MDDEEAEALLRGLMAALGEFGATAGGPPRHDLPEDGETDVRSELARVLDEYEALLVGAPDMMRETMRLLDAHRISFVTDRHDVRFEGRDAGPREGRPDEVAFTPDDIGEWLRLGAEAKPIIAELRRRLDDDAR